MNTDTLLTSAENLGAWLDRVIDGLPVASDTRTRLAAACFDQVHEHQKALIVLTRHKLVGSAFSLVRPTFETYIRGIWLARCASDAEVAQFQKGRVDKTFARLIADVETNQGYGSGVLSNVKRKSWPAMNQYTHGGYLQAVRRLTEDSIQPNFADDEIVEVINFGQAIALLAASEIVLMAKREDLLEPLLEKMKALGAGP